MKESSGADILELIIRLAQAEGLPEEAAQIIEQTVRSEYGGQRVFIPKRKKGEHARRQAFADAVSNLPTKEVTERHGISRATLYRMLKRGG